VYISRRIAEIGHKSTGIGGTWHKTEGEQILVQTHAQSDSDRETGSTRSWVLDSGSWLEKKSTKLCAARGSCQCSEDDGHNTAEECV
jgi:hypothetical protein